MGFITYNGEKVKTLINKETLNNMAKLLNHETALHNISTCKEHVLVYCEYNLVERIKFYIIDKEATDVHVNNTDHE